jgi:hypothetical protein
LNAPVCRLSSVPRPIVHKRTAACARTRLTVGTRHNIRFVLLLIVALAVHGSALAQPQRSGVVIAGVVVDQTGAVIPQAHVEFKGGSGDQNQSAMSDESGMFRFAGVPQGRYELVVSFPGFQATTVRVTIGARSPAPVRVLLPLAAITQEVTVGNVATQVRTDAESNLDVSSVDQHAIENLPVFNQDVLATMSRFLDSSAIGTSGPTLVVNGIEVNNLNMSASAIQRIRINHDPYSAEYPRPGRGRIEVILKPGAAEYHGTGNIVFRDSHLDERNAFAAVKPPEQRRIFEGFLGGPVGHSDKTSFTLSLKDNADDTQAVVFAEGVSGAIQENLRSPRRNVLAAGALNHRRADNTLLSLTLSYQNQTRHNQGVGGVALPSAATDWNFSEQAAVYTQQTILTPKLLNQFRLFAGQEFESTNSVSNAPKLVVLDAFTGGGAQGSQRRTEHHFTLTEMLTWSPGRHVINAGVNIPDWSRRRFDDNTNTGGTFYFSSLADYEAARPYAFIQHVGNGHVAFLEKVAGLFVQDEIRVSPKLSTTVGLRYDWQNYFHDDNNFAPRGSFAFAPVADGGTVIRGGAGVFYDRSGPRPIQDILRFDGIRLLRYVVVNPGYPDPFPSGRPLGSEAPSTVQLAPDIVIPWMVQYSLAVERRLRKSTSASVTYVASRGFDQFRSRDLNAPTPPLFATRPDPTRGVVRDIESAGRMVANSLQFTLRGQLTRFVNTQAQYTLSETKNNTSGVTWMPPNNYDLSLEYARADFDQRHRLDVLATIKPASLFNVGVALALYSGRPYSLTTGQDQFNTGVANARPAGVPRNSAEGPNYAELDLRWSRELPFSRGRKGNGPTATVGLDVFNVLNRVNYTSYVGTLTSPFFGRAVAAEPPRRLQLSLRMRF